MPERPRPCALSLNLLSSPWYVVECSGVMRTSNASGSYPGARISTRCGRSRCAASGDAVEVVHDADVVAVDVDLGWRGLIFRRSAPSSEKLVPPP